MFSPPVAGIYERAKTDIRDASLRTTIQNTGPPVGGPIEHKVFRETFPSRSIRGEDHWARGGAPIVSAVGTTGGCSRPASLEQFRDSFT
jgi:hypothetical protein